MRLKHRVKKIEEMIVPHQKHKLWIIRDSYSEDKRDPKGKQRTEKKIQEIEEGKIKHKDGTFYQKGDTFMILSRIFLPVKPDAASKISKNDNHRKVITLPGPTIEERIKALEQKKRELERQIKEGKK